MVELTEKSVNWRNATFSKTIHIIMTLIITAVSISLLSIMTLNAHSEYHSAFWLSDIQAECHL
jgi:hypothetical protein